MSFAPTINWRNLCVYPQGILDNIDRKTSCSAWASGSLPLWSPFFLLGHIFSAGTTCGTLRIVSDLAFFFKSICFKSDPQVNLFNWSFAALLNCVAWKPLDWTDWQRADAGGQQNQPMPNTYQLVMSVAGNYSAVQFSPGSFRFFCSPHWPSMV